MNVRHIIPRPLHILYTQNICNTWDTHTTIKGNLDEKKGFIAGTNIAMINPALAKCLINKTGQ